MCSIYDVKLLSPRHENLRSWMEFTRAASLSTVMTLFRALMHPPSLLWHCSAQLCQDLNCYSAKLIFQLTAVEKQNSRIVEGRAIGEKGSFLYLAERAPCGVLLKEYAKNWSFVHWQYGNFSITSKMVEKDEWLCRGRRGTSAEGLEGGAWKFGRSGLRFHICALGYVT